MPDDRNHFRYEGKKLDVVWDRRLCIHVGECGRAKGELFVGGRKPWCQPDLTADDGEAAEVIDRCPTGAITIEAKEGDYREEPAATNTITVANHGPLYLRGDLEIEGAADDMPGVKFRAALCRCGKSKNKPFCDNTHESAEFRDRGAVGDAGPGFEAEGGKLTVKAFEDGPLMATGNLTILSSSGRPTYRGTKCVLCRCGESGNKPFCDGSHKKAGFKSS